MQSNNYGEYTAYTEYAAYIAYTVYTAYTAVYIVYREGICMYVYVCIVLKPPAVSIVVTLVCVTCSPPPQIRTLIIQPLLFLKCVQYVTVRYNVQQCVTMHSRA